MEETGEHFPHLDKSVPMETFTGQKSNRGSSTDRLP